MRHPFCKWSEMFSQSGEHHHNRGCILLE